MRRTVENQLILINLDQIVQAIRRASVQFLHRLFVKRNLCHLVWYQDLDFG